MAPEQYFTPHLVDIRADVYGLGCTLYSLLCGQPPFQGPDNTVQKKMLAHRDQPLPSLRAQRPDLPAAVEEVLFWMMAKSPMDRFENPAEAARSLALFSAGHDLPRLLDAALERSDASHSGPSPDPRTTASL
jgi:serine/threonine protein kinase